MTFGGSPIGSLSFGDWTVFHRSIEKGDPTDLGPTFEICDDLGASLISYFTAHPNEMTGMHHRRFEELVAAIFDRFGYEVELTQQSRDGGYDVLAIRHREISECHLIECKRWHPERKVSVGIVRALEGVRSDFRATKGILATTSYFTKPATHFLEKHKWELEGHDFEGLKKWLDRLQNDIP